MIKINFKKYLLYLIRWQLSTPILAVALIWFSTMGQLVATVIANFIGGLIFFWVDMFIFTSRKLSVEWEVKDNIKCSDCGGIARGYRIIKTPNYDKTNDKAPKFRCEHCSKEKTRKLKHSGVIVS